MLHEQTNDQKSASSGLPFLLRRLRDDATKLVQAEMALAKLEWEESVERRRIALSVFVLSAGLILLGTGLFLVGAITIETQILVERGMEPMTALWMSAFATGLLILALGLGFLAVQSRVLSRRQTGMKKTKQTLKEGQLWVAQKWQ